MESDPIKPEYYKKNSFELIDIIQDLPFWKGNSIKYIFRAGNKDSEIHDLKKAIWYLERRIKILEETKK